NGKLAKTHAGNEEMFLADVTKLVKPGAANLLAVRIVKPAYRQVIDDMELGEIPHRNQADNISSGSDYNYGGLTDSVELLVVPCVNIRDVYVKPDWKTGEVKVYTTVYNDLGEKTKTSLDYTVAPAMTGGDIVNAKGEQVLNPGENVVETTLKVPDFKLWSLEEPNLYRITVTSDAAKTNLKDSWSTRFGFRDFRFEDGFFKLNGKRIFVKCNHSGGEAPVGIRVGLTEETFRKDLINFKAMGFNMQRFIAGIGKRYQSDLADELGLMIFQESFAAWCMSYQLSDNAKAWSEKMFTFWDNETKGMIKRDRNHPSVVIWCLLNETYYGDIHKHAHASLGDLSALDDTRVFILSSGNWHQKDWKDEHKGDNTYEAVYANPGDKTWRIDMNDIHPYQPVPHRLAEVTTLRTTAPFGYNVFISEYGVGSGMNLDRLVRKYDEIGWGEAVDAQAYRHWKDQFMSYWDAWNMDTMFASPSAFSEECIAAMAKQRQFGIDCLRSNPKMIGYSVTGGPDHGFTGEGLVTKFREFKPGTVDAISECFAKLRMCSFAEPMNLYSNMSTHIDGVLINEDVLKAGTYPVRVQLVNKADMTRVFDKTYNVKVTGTEKSFVIPVFDENLSLNGCKAGTYTLRMDMLSGGAPTCSETDIYVYEPLAKDALKGKKVTLWKSDADLEAFLKSLGCDVSVYKNGDQPKLVVVTDLSGDTDTCFGLAEKGGATLLMLKCVVGAEMPLPVGKYGDYNGGRLPALAQKDQWLYLRDDFAKPGHPVFDGLPTGFMDHFTYRQVIGHTFWHDMPAPDDFIAAGIDTSWPFENGVKGGITLGGYKYGNGMLYVNSLNLRECVGNGATGEIILVNLIKYLAK
ncbi:MAG: hypothetical protein IJT09_02285, partial [Abditibacteriota bacterium]|nr:hypothetical protein [Abditibacteriota bacterium]